MSTVGVGAAAAVAAPVAAVALAGAAIVGAGILVARGAMWVGEKIEENYQATCQEWNDLKQRALAESRTNVQEMSTYIATQLEYMTVDAYLGVDSATPQVQPVIKQQGFLDALARLRTAQDDAMQIARQQNDNEIALLAARLRAEIKMGQDTLPSEVIAAARQSLQGTSASMRAALQSIETAWTNVTAKERRQARLIQQTQQTLAVITSKLSAIDTLLQDTVGATPAATHARYIEEKRQLERQLVEAQDQLDAENVAQAAEIARRIRQSIDPLMASVSANAWQAWEQFRVTINTQLGSLAALSTMVQEAQALNLVEPARLSNLEQRINAARNAANDLLRGVGTHQQERLQQLMHRVALLKDDVFAEVAMNQQRQIAQTIQSTLSELDFQAGTREQATLQRNGDVLHVEVMVAKGDAIHRDDKIIAFEIARDGQVAYDFSGYTGSSCVADAQKVFAALCDKGLFILDDDALEKLERLPIEQQTIETLRQEQFQTRITQNKTQAELAETLKGVLKQMGYQNLHESSVGGFIELEAFQGSKGYHVTLSPEGDAQVLKDEVDVTGNTQDVVAESAQAIQQEVPEPVKKQKKSRTSYTRSRRQNMIS